MSISLCTVDDVAAVAKAVPDADFARVSRLIEIVSARVVRYTGQQFVQTTETVTITPHDGILRVPQQPVTAVTSVSQVGFGGTYDWFPNGYIKPSQLSNYQNGNWLNGYWPEGGIYNPTGAALELGWPPIPVTVTYTHGYAADSYPDDVAGVVAEVAAAKWLAGETTAQGVVSEKIDMYSLTLHKNDPVAQWSPEHKAILDTYRRSGLASIRLSTA